MKTTISKEQAIFIKEYIEKLENQFAIYEDKLEYILNETSTFDLIYEIINIFKVEMPELEDSLILNNDSLYRDANVVLGFLKKYLVDNGYKNDKEKNTPLSKFWKSFITYFENELPNTDYLKNEYLGYDNCNNGTYFVNIDYNYQFNLHYGFEYDPDEFSKISYIKLFIELAFAEWIKSKKRYDFTKKINTIFRNFKLPYKLQNGKVISRGYKTTYIDSRIINYYMLDKKIQFAEEMILSSETLDKKCALDYIVDSLQYLISIQSGETVKNKYSNSAILICGNNTSKQYTVLNNEINELMKIANEFFDIRHNEYLNKAKEKREPITSPILIEYLYNRFFGILYPLKIKTNNLQ